MRASDGRQTRNWRSTSSLKTRHDRNIARAILFRKVLENGIPPDDWDQFRVK